MPDADMPRAERGGARFLVVRMGSLGDIVHTLPAVAALRDSFPAARIDWLIDRKWRALLEGNPDVSEIIEVDRRSLGNLVNCVRRLREAHYTCALDFQSLYKSAALAFGSGAPRRVGFIRSYLREPGAAFFYTERAHPQGKHKVEHNLSLVESVGAKRTGIRFPLFVSPAADAEVESKLSARGLQDFFVLSPGGGWRYKCWLPERFGELHRELARRHGWRGVISFGPGEEALAEKARRAAGKPEPAVLSTNVAQLMALLRRAKFVVAGDTGPLHLASGFGISVVGLFGPTDPARNGPYCSADIVVRNVGPEETTYRRDASYSRAMISITVDQVVEAVERRVGIR
jgi:ADP-heptose:LPS heptosyltransferase